MKSGRRILLVIVALAALGGVAALIWPREREPVYQGKTLSQWLGKSRVPQGLYPGEPDPQAAEALTAMGTNAISWLMKWVAYERPAWRQGLCGVAAKVPFMGNKRFIGEWLWGDEAYVNKAIQGFWILGAHGRLLIPGLTEIATNGHSPVAVSQHAVTALYYTGHAALPALIEVLSDVRAPRNTRVAAGMYVSQWWVDWNVSGPEEIYPKLARALSDRDGYVRSAATNAALRIAPELLGKRLSERHLTE